MSGVRHLPSWQSCHQCHQGHRLFLPFSFINFYFFGCPPHLKAIEIPSASGTLIGKKGGIFLDMFVVVFAREENAICKQCQHHHLYLLHLPPASRLILRFLAWVGSQSCAPIWRRLGRMRIRYFYLCHRRQDLPARKGRRQTTSYATKSV